MEASPLPGCVGARQMGRDTVKRSRWPSLRVVVPASVLLVLLVLLFTRMTAPNTNASPGRPRLTADEAIGIARAFASQIGAPIQGQGQAVYPAPKQSASLPEPYWQPRWKVTFGGDVEFEIVDANGVICRYADRRVHAGPGQPARSRASVAQAAIIRRGEAVRLAAGPVPETGEPEARRASPGQPDDDTWFVIWPRVSGDAPYKDEQLIVVIRGRDGAVSAMTARYPSTPSWSWGSGVSETDAIAAARAHLAEFGIKGVSIVHTAREVVQPSTGWETAMGTKAEGGASVDAWVCEFWAGARNYLVYVDAASGRVVGGEFREVARALAPGPS